MLVHPESRHTSNAARCSNQQVAKWQGGSLVERACERLPGLFILDAAESIGDAAPSHMNRFSPISGLFEKETHDRHVHAARRATCVCNKRAVVKSGRTESKPMGRRLRIPPFPALGMRDTILSAQMFDKPPPSMPAHQAVRLMAMANGLFSGQTKDFMRNRTRAWR